MFVPQVQSDRMEFSGLSCKVFKLIRCQSMPLLEEFEQVFIQHKKTLKRPLRMKFFKEAAYLCHVATHDLRDVIFHLLRDPDFSIFQVIAFQFRVER